MLLPFLRAHVRQETERGIPVELNSSNWRDLARAHANRPVSRKLEKALEHMARHSSSPGDPVAVNCRVDYPLFDAADDRETGFLLEHLKERRLVKQLGDGLFVLTVEGWAQLEPRGTGGISGHCFVAMSFDQSLREAYEQGIRAAIEDDCKLLAVRVDLVEHNENICDRIVVEIKKAQFMVADFTLHRAGVYFETGYAAGLGRPVIWTCRKDELQRTHFDTRQYNHIDWADPGDLRKRLADRIRATVLK
jgi:nucleoside 2-deoxyribosyltransferase